jgi:hypothetical protein
MLTCGLAFVCAGALAPEASPVPAVAASPAATLTDPCGGDQELLKKYLSASPCVFVLGQASVQLTYSGSNVPIVITHETAGHVTEIMESSQAFGYPGAVFNIGITNSSQITIVAPSYTQIQSTQTGAAAGSTDMEFRYKALVYRDSKRGILGGILATYGAPTGSPGISAGSPSYQINPLLNVALNRARSIAENVSFPVTNAAASSGSGRSWSFAPQAVTLWRSPGGTLLAAIVQYAFTTKSAYLTINAAQLIARNLQLQGTFGGNSANVDYVNPVENAGPGHGVAYSRSFTIGASYLIGRSEPLAP